MNEVYEENNQSSSESEGSVQQLQLPRSEVFKAASATDLKILHPHEAAEYAEYMVYFINFIRNHGVDTLFMMDNSGRPALTLFNLAWKSLFNDSVKIPQTHSINENVPAGVAILPALSEAEIEALRRRYGAQEGSTLCIADDYVTTGRQIFNTRAIVHQVYPENSILCTSIFTELPRWHKKPDWLGIQDGPVTADPERAFLAQEYKPNVLRRLAQGMRIVPNSVKGLNHDLEQVAGLIKQFNAPADRQVETVPSYFPLPLNPLYEGVKTELKPQVQMED
jgi:hypothetical protein